MPSIIEAYQLSGAAKSKSEHINGKNSASPASTFKHKFDDLEVGQNHDHACTFKSRY